MGFNKPQAADGIKWQDLYGTLLAVESISHETGIQTVYGEANAVKANIYVLDGDKKGTSYRETLIFPKMLQVGAGEPGNFVLARLIQGKAKPGQRPPWMFEAVTDEATNEKATQDMLNLFGVDVNDPDAPF